MAVARVLPPDALPATNPLSISSSDGTTSVFIVTPSQPHQMIAAVDEDKWRSGCGSNCPTRASMEKGRYKLFD